VINDRTSTILTQHEDKRSLLQSSLLMIDNYDSFTYNLVQYFQALGVEVAVAKNDEITLADIEAQQPHYIVISPGPCSPNEAGISLAVIEAFMGKIPILGVCLGYQALAQVFGASIVRAEQLMHGKTSAIYHNGHGVFSDLPSPFMATRYHSLVVDKTTLPDCLEITAWTQDEAGNIDDIMGLRHKTLAIEGVQFHPESILSEHGHALLNNFIQSNNTE